MERFNRLFWLPCRNKVIDKLILLRPPTSFYAMVYLMSMILLWALSILVSGIRQHQAYSLSPANAVGFSFVIALITSIISFPLTYCLFLLYSKEIKRIFLSEILDNDEVQKIE